MCWRAEGTFITARRCCGVFVILAPDIKLQTYLLTYLAASEGGVTNLYVTHMQTVDKAAELSPEK